MMVRTKKQTFLLRRLAMPVLWMLLVAWTGFHALHGERGLYALMRERAELAQLQTDMAQTKAEREKMELRTSHLRDSSLDRDLLDEQMRRMLGVMRKGEVVVLTGNSSKS